MDNLAASSTDVPIQVCLFGVFTLRIHGQLVTDFRSNKVRALLAYLLLESPQPRSALAALLWEHEVDEMARNSLKSALSNLRRLLGPYATLLVADNFTVQLERVPTTLWCDALAFAALVAQHDPEGHQPLSTAYLQQALALQRGELLTNLSVEEAPHFQEWLQTKRIHYREQLRQLFPHNLPRALTSLVGRDAEVALLHQSVLAAAQPLVTIVGAGGIGKTRVALAVADSVRGHFLDGVWWVNLADLIAHNEPAAGLAAVIGVTLQINFIGQQPVTQQLLFRLRTKRLLLVLDNFEQLVETTPWLLTLIQSAPGLKLLITSRQRLPTQAATLFTLAELALPPTTPLSVERLQGYPSVQLFLTRAQRLRPKFTLNDKNQDAISHICHLTTGLPLALELAAALVEVYSSRQVAALLAEDLAALTTDAVDLPLRHRSLQSVLAQSWQLLTPRESEVLTQCAVFEQTFTLAAVQTITGATVADLQRLVAKSLLRQAQQDEDLFFLHNLVRRYAEQRLAAQPTLAYQANEGHSRYFMGLLQAWTPELPNSLAVQRLAHGELANLRTAWDWAVEHGRVDLLTQGLDGLYWLYLLLGLNQEATTLFRVAAESLARAVDESAPADDQIRLLARLWLVTAEFYRCAGHAQESADCLTAALRWEPHHADSTLTALARYEAARQTQVRGEFVHMHQFAAEACVLAPRTSPLLVVQCLNVLAVALIGHSRFAEAIQTLQQALDQLGQQPNRHWEAKVIGNLSIAYHWNHQYMAALTHRQRASELAQVTHDLQEICVSFTCFVYLLTQLGAFEQAHMASVEATKLLEQVQLPYWESWLHAWRAKLFYLQGDLEQAYQESVAALRVAATPQQRQAIHSTLPSLGRIWVEYGAVTEAKTLYQQALELSERAGPTPRNIDAKAGLAELYLRQNQVAAAQEQLVALLPKLTERRLILAEDPFQVYWSCYCVLYGTDDPRASQVLETAYHLLQITAAEITDQEFRRSFLENIPANRALCQVFTARSLV